MGKKQNNNKIIISNASLFIGKDIKVHQENDVEKYIIQELIEIHILNTLSLSLSACMSSSKSLIIRNKYTAPIVTDLPYLHFQNNCHVLFIKQFV